MIKQTGRLVGACRFVLAGDGLTLTYRQVYDDPNTVKTAANGGSRHDI